MHSASLVSTAPQDPNIAAVLEFLKIVKQLFISAQQDSDDGRKWKSLVQWEFPQRAQLAGIAEGNVLRPEHPYHEQFLEFACWHKVVERLLASPPPIAEQSSSQSVPLFTEASPLLPLRSPQGREEVQINYYVAKVQRSSLWNDFYTQHGPTLKKVISNPSLLQATLYEIETTKSSRVGFGTLQEDRLLQHVLQFLVRMMSNPSMPSPLNAVPRNGWFYALWAFYSLAVFSGLMGGLMSQNAATIQELQKHNGWPVSSTDDIIDRMGPRVLLEDCSNMPNMSVPVLTPGMCDFSTDFIVYLVVTLCLTLPLLLWRAVSNTPAWYRGDQHKLMMERLQEATTTHLQELGFNAAQIVLICRRQLNTEQVGVLCTRLSCDEIADFLNTYDLNNNNAVDLRWIAFLFDKGFVDSQITKLLEPLRLHPRDIVLLIEGAKKIQNHDRSGVPPSSPKVPYNPGASKA